MYNSTDFMYPLENHGVNHGPYTRGNYVFFQRTTSAFVSETRPREAPKCLSAQISQIRPKIPYISGLKYPIRCKDVTMSHKVTQKVTRRSQSENQSKKKRKKVLVCPGPTGM